jgi:ubiquinone/menaquinone biosynthesis C-methylase UbiE
VHFESHRAAYEAILGMAGFQPGWRMLDAGCGSGNYVPLIAALVGAGGHVTAMDLAPENIEAARTRIKGWHLAGPVDVVEGSVTDLPFPDDSFDGVWCANVGQYLPDDAFEAALLEFRRVTRPGGLVAIKDVDLGMAALYPGEPQLFSRVFTQPLRSPGWNQAKGGFGRCWTMQRHLERAGFVDVWQRSVAIELRAPLAPVQRQYLSQLFADFSEMVAAGREVPEEDRAAWAMLGDPDHPEHPLHSPDLYYREGQMLAVGRVPEA